MQRDNRQGPTSGIIGRRCDKTAAILRLRAALEAKGYRVEDVTPDGVFVRKGLGLPWFVSAGLSADA